MRQAHGGDGSLRAFGDVRVDGGEALHAFRAEADTLLFDESDEGFAQQGGVAVAGGECILLGANAPTATLDGWLTDAASNGFTGFAIGRSIWWDSLKGLLDGSLTRPAAVAAVAANYRAYAGTFLR